MSSTGQFNSRKKRRKMKGKERERERIKMYVKIPPSRWSRGSALCVHSLRTFLHSSALRLVAAEPYRQSLRRLHGLPWRSLYRGICKWQPNESTGILERNDRQLGIYTGVTRINCVVHRRTVTVCFSFFFSLMVIVIIINGVGILIS